MIPFGVRAAGDPQAAVVGALHLGEKGLCRQGRVGRVLGEGDARPGGELGVALQGGADAGQLILYALEGVLLGGRQRRKYTRAKGKTAPKEYNVVPITSSNNYDS